MPAIRTPVMVALDRLGISYRPLPHAGPAYTVEDAARQRGVAVEEMVKSILLRDGAGRYVLACVTGDARLDPRRVRDALGEGWRRLQFAGPEEIQAVTGYPLGAVAPVALAAGLPVLFDVAILTRARVNISSGDPRLGLELAAEDLLRAAGARPAVIAAG